MTIRVFEAFSGVGSQRMALRNLGIDHEVVAISDVDEFTVKSYAAIHDNGKTVSEVTEEEMQDYLEKRNIPLNDKGVRKILKGKKLKEFYEACIKSNNLGDISKVETHDIPDHDLFTYSFPCFTGDSLVLTDTGYKRIDEINIGDMVLTHTNQYKKVTNVFNQGVKDIVNVKGMAIHNIKTTENHKFLTRERHRLWNNDRRSYDRLFHAPEWVEAKDLSRDHYLGLAINQKSELPIWDGYTNSWNTGYGMKTYHTDFIKPLLENNDFWWLMGRYVADGWHRSQSGIVIAVPDSKLEEFENRVNGLFDYNISKERTANKIHIPIKELELFTGQFGYYAHGKKVSPEVLNLPVDLLKSFIEGYFSGDGSYSKDTGLYKCTSVSEELIYGIGQCIAKAYHRPYSIYKTNRPDTHVIEGGTVNQRDTYSLHFKMTTGKQDKAFYEDGHIWFPFNGLENSGKETVYDIEVEDDHSFTVFNTIVHNCQDISVAGKGSGLDEGSDTRSGLLWECQKVIYGKRPKYLLLENVKNLVGKKHKHNFDKWLEWLEKQGYTNYWQVLNAKDYGIPQNRERVFVVSILGHHEPYEFPEPIELELRLKDVLEDQVDEKYYLDNEKANKLISTVASKHEINEPTPTDGSIKKPRPKEVANAIMARYDCGVSNQQSIGTMVIEPNNKKDSDSLAVGFIPRTNGTQHQSNTVYRIDKESPSVSATDYKNPIKVLLDNDTTDNEPKAERLGGIFDKDGTRHQAGAVWDKEQLSPTLDTMQGGWRQPSIITHNYTEQVKVRKHEVDIVTLKDLLRSHKQASGKTNREISELLDEPMSLVEHWFRNDNSFAIPKEDKWMQLKEILSISTDSFDKQIMEFEIRDGVFDQANRAYDGNGISPTLTATDGDKKVVVDQVRRLAETKRPNDEIRVTLKENGDIRPHRMDKKKSGIQELNINHEDNPSHTVTTNHMPKVYGDTTNLRIRKLTPKECWRLMGFSDDDFHKAEEVNSATQLYKQAGNSIVVDVLEGIFKQLLEEHK